MATTHIIIADDHSLFADGLEQIIQSLPGYEVIAKVTDGKQLLKKLNSELPDIILMDINMPFLNGMEAAEKILKLYPNIKIVFISMYHNPKLIEQAKLIGVPGFLMKDITTPILKEAIIKINLGESVYLNPHIQTKYTPWQETNDHFLRKYKLTEREIEIIKLIKEGNATKQIAANLELSIYTVETHRKNINRKLNVQSTAELIAMINKNHY